MYTHPLAYAFVQLHTVTPIPIPDLDSHWAVFAPSPQACLQHTTRVPSSHLVAPVEFLQGLLPGIMWSLHTGMLFLPISELLASHLQENSLS